MAEKQKTDETKIVFTEDELKSLEELRVNYNTIQSDFGVIKVRKILLQQQLDGLEQTEIELETKYSENQQNEQRLVKELNDKYGAGNLDVATGEFTPNIVEEPSNS
tara:strand:- start:2358 stop:2675 length:318 start_codon:yes stop_codon:yes gene_type:complete